MSSLVQLNIKQNDLVLKYKINLDINLYNYYCNKGNRYMISGLEIKSEYNKHNGLNRHYEFSNVANIEKSYRLNFNGGNETEYKINIRACESIAQIKFTSIERRNLWIKNMLILLGVLVNNYKKNG